jgi:hypothetical protein
MRIQKPVEAYLPQPLAREKRGVAFAKRPLFETLITSLTHLVGIFLKLLSGLDFRSAFVIAVRSAGVGLRAAVVTAAAPSAIPSPTTAQVDNRFKRAMLSQCRARSSGSTARGL